MNKKIVFGLLSILFFTCIGTIAVSAKNPVQRKSILFDYPKEYNDWPNGLMAGNGKMGVIVFGDPLNERVIYNDRKFFMAASNERTFNTVSAVNLKKIRDYCVEEKWKEANDLANEVHGWKDGGEGNKHPGYEMLIKIPASGEVKNYSRECDFRTGEIIVKWTDNRGNWERRTFVSRKDNVIVQYLKAPSKGKLNCLILLDTEEGMHLSSLKFTNKSDVDFLNLRANYPSNTNGAGYEGVTRIVCSGGEKSMDDNRLNIKNANSVILLTKIEKYYSDCENEWNKKNLQSALTQLPSTDYNTLLQGQKETHQAIFDRIKLDLGAGNKERALSNTKLIEMQKQSSSAVLALWERIFDSGRYLYLSSSSDVAAPDLLGLWTGDSKVGWSGYYHLDANLNLQIASGNIGNMPEAMEGYFTLMERLSDGFKVNATKLLGCRGMAGGGNTAGLNGLISKLSQYYPYQYVTGEMGWLLYPFWEHYLITGDKEFLRNRLYPLMKEMGWFYEDFLVREDVNGKYIFAGSISPEAQPAGIGNSLVNNSTFDIAGAKFCLEKLIEMCNMFGYEQGAGEGVERWSAILKKLPPYLINDDGALSEWSWPSLKDRNTYGHRHSSHLIPVWPLNEISKEMTPTLYTAAQIALKKKDETKYEDAGHGLLHAALHAANLNNGQSVNNKLMHFLKTDFFFSSLATAHFGNFRVFCTDVCHAVPGVMMEMLVNSKNDVIELLPALPQTLTKGSISGLKTRNRATIESLEWNLSDLTIKCTIKSDIDQDITLIQRQGIVSIESNAAISPSNIGNAGRIVKLKAGKSANIIMKINSVSID
ncbi:MAG: glycoside hydrolase N-terminal domain-containing protein [Tannerellaceae bacterium]|jgi:hypothetical protein|nr:glycoside hydrolase N-terminal domain-containing protein [Tannerellaceae bacterium]